MASRDAPHFRVATETDGDTVVVTVHGELDIASASMLRETFLDLIAREPRPDLTIDASGLTFVDSSGLAVLMMGARRWDEAGKRIALRDPSTTLVRLLDLTGVRRAFDL